MRIKGYWDEYVYEKDEYGEPIYFTPKVVEKEPEDLTGWIDFKCPCDDKTKWVRFVVNEPYKSTVRTDDLSRFGKEVYINGSQIPIYTTDEFIESSLKPAEIIVNNFTNFKHSIGTINESEDRFNVVIQDYELPRTIKEIQSDNYKVNIDEKYRLLEYRWNGCDMSMSTISHNNNIGFAENIDFVYHSHYDNNNKRLLFATNNDRDTIYSTEQEFYISITKNLINSKGEEIVKTFLVPIGKFYIAEDLNIPQPEEEYAIYNIDNKTRKIKYLDTLTKYVAPDTFAIDVDKNIISYQYFQMQKYAQTELTVFLDPKTMKPFENNTIKYITKKGLTITGNLRVIKKGEIYYKQERRKTTDDYSQGRQIVVSAKTFPGAFRLVGETYIRDRFGKEQRLQIDIPLCKLSSNTNLNLTADGEPVTVDMTLKAMRKQDGTLIKFTYYDVDKNCLVPFDWKKEEKKQPTLSTEAGIDGSKIIPCAAAAPISDRGTYTELEIGKTYTILTDLVDKETRRTVGSNEMTFVPTTSFGTFEVRFTVNTEDYSEKELVIFETIKDGASIVVTHADINDSNQTLTVEKKDTPLTLTIQSPQDTEMYCLPKDCQPPYDGKTDTYINFEGVAAESSEQHREICSILFKKEGEEINESELSSLIENTTIIITRGEAT